MTVDKSRVELRRYTATEFSAIRQIFIDLYAEVFAQEINEPFWSVEKFAERIDRHAAMSGFDAVVASLRNRPIGYAYGITLPATTRWWATIRPPLTDPEFTREDGNRTFALFEAKSAWAKGHLMRRLTTASLAALKDQLSERDRAILADLERTRVLTGAQLQRLRFTHIDQDSQARDRRRVLQRLTDLDLVSTLDRRIGGTRAGSAGHIYTLTPAGRRLQALQRGQQLTKRLRRAHTPGAPFLDHALAISDIYVTLHKTNRNQNFHVSTYDTEPACWHTTGNNQYLHPDAYLVLATPAHQDCWWLAIDQATESLPRIKRKCRAYLDFLTHGGLGPDNVPPRILFTTADAQRTTAIQKVITTLTTTETNPLICVTIHTDAPRFLITELTEP